MLACVWSGRLVDTGFYLPSAAAAAAAHPPLSRLLVLKAFPTMLRYIRYIHNGVHKFDGKVELSVFFT